MFSLRRLVSYHRESFCILPPETSSRHGPHIITLNCILTRQNVRHKVDSACFSSKVLVKHSHCAPDSRAFILAIQYSVLIDGGCQRYEPIGREGRQWLGGGEFLFRKRNYTFLLIDACLERVMCRACRDVACSVRVAPCALALDLSGEGLKIKHTVARIDCSKLFHHNEE